MTLPRLITTIHDSSRDTIPVRTSTRPLRTSKPWIEDRRAHSLTFTLGLDEYSERGVITLTLLILSLLLARRGQLCRYYRPQGVQYEWVYPEDDTLVPMSNIKTAIHLVVPTQLDIILI